MAGYGSYDYEPGDAASSITNTVNDVNMKKQKSEAEMETGHHPEYSWFSEMVKDATDAYRLCDQPVCVEAERSAVGRTHKIKVTIGEYGTDVEETVEDTEGGESKE